MLGVARPAETDQRSRNEGIQPAKGRKKGLNEEATVLGRMKKIHVDEEYLPAFMYFSLVK
jgi:hypothetical protein